MIIVFYQNNLAEQLTSYLTKTHSTFITKIQVNRVGKKCWDNHAHKLGKKWGVLGFQSGLYGRNYPLLFKWLAGAYRRTGNEVKRL